MLVRRAFSGDDPPRVVMAERYAERVEDFAWCAKERPRRLSFAPLLRLAPRNRRTIRDEGETERQANAVRMHLDAEEREAFAVGELSRALPETKPGAFDRLLAASARYRSLPDGAINEAAPLLTWMEFAVSRRGELAAKDEGPTFAEALDEFRRRMARSPDDSDDAVARLAILSFGVDVGPYTAHLRGVERKAKAAAKAARVQKVADPSASKTPRRTG